MRKKEMSTKAFDSRLDPGSPFLLSSSDTKLKRSDKADKLDSLEKQIRKDLAAWIGRRVKCWL
jgi:hypothetical protein